MKHYLKTTVELLSFAAPIICLFDCIVLPLLSAFLPFLGWHELVHGVSDQFLTLVVFSFCLPAIVPGIVKHKNSKVLSMYVIAACLMLFTNLVAESLDSALHFLLSLSASALLLAANWLNRRLLSCSCTNHHHQFSQASSHEKKT